MRDTIWLVTRPQIFAAQADVYEEFTEHKSGQKCNTLAVTIGALRGKQSGAWWPQTKEKSWEPCVASSTIPLGNHEHIHGGGSAMDFQTGICY